MPPVCELNALDLLLSLTRPDGIENFSSSALWFLPLRAVRSTSILNLGFSTFETRLLSSGYRRRDKLLVCPLTVLASFWLWS